MPTVRRALLIATCVLATVTTAVAQQPTTTAVDPAPGGEPRMGQFVSWDGDRVVLASYRGHLTVFEPEAGGWTQRAATDRTVVSSASALTQMSADGGLIAFITRPRMRNGDLVLYEYRRGALSEPTQINPGLYTTTVLVEDGEVFLGAPAARRGGAVDVIARSGETWSRRQRLQGSVRGWSNRFGAALDAHGGVLAVGDPGADGPSRGESGMVYVFRKSGGQWQEAEQIRPPDDAPLAARRSFGKGVAVTDGWIYVTAGPTGALARSRGAGNVLAYRQTGSGWVHEATMALPPSDRVRQLGNGLSARGACVAAEYSGRTHDEAVFLFCEQTGWAPQRISVSTRQAGFGTSFDWGPRGLLAGSYLHRNGRRGPYPGRAYVIAPAPEPPSIRDCRVAGVRRVGQSLTLTADVDRAESVLVDWGDGARSSGLAATHAFAQPGTYTLRARAINAAGSDTCTLRVEVAAVRAQLSVRVGGLERRLGAPAFASNRLPVHIEVTNDGDAALLDVEVVGTFAGLPLEVGLTDYETGERHDVDGDGRIDVVAPGASVTAYAFSEGMSSPTQSGDLIVTAASGTAEATARDRVSVALAWSGDRGAFRLDRDAYSFANPSALSIQEIVDELTSLASIRRLTFNPLAYRVLSVLSHFKDGRCYGMAGTSGVYFMNAATRPAPGAVAAYDLATPGVASQINRYFALQFINRPEGDPEVAYERLLSELSAGRPAMLAFGTGGWRGGGHAVLAIQAATFERAATTHVLSYDSNMVDADAVIGVEVAVISRPSLEFRSPWYTDQFGFDTMYTLPVMLSDEQIEDLLSRG